MGSLTQIQDARWKKNIWRSREFAWKDDPSCGFTFSCDDKGEPRFTAIGQRENYAFCLAHADKIVDLGIVDHEQEYREPAIGICSCGARVIMVPQYMDACECPGCGQWYSIAGYPIKSPDHWNDYIY